jgi:membrane-associated phospholipid phosphatase
MIGPKQLRVAGVALLVGFVLTLGGAPAAHAGPAASPGDWQTWVLSSGAQFRLAPPDTASTEAELAELRALRSDVDGQTLERVAWWNAVAPSYRWNQIALEQALRAGLNANMASRHLAVLHTALADAMVAAWDSKRTHDRPRPAKVDPTLATTVPTPDSPSYPDESAVAGAVAAAVLGAIFPDRTAEFARLADEQAQTRLLAGIAFPSDVAAGVELGRKVAAVALERARGDGFDQPWTGSVPKQPGLWNGEKPVMPQAAHWKPWLLASPDEFRPAPPAAFDSPERAAEMAELRAFERTPATNAAAMFWEVAVGGLRNFEYWNNHAGRLLLEYGQDGDTPRAARVYALLNVALYDAGVACWDAKYAYWTIRAFQLDSAFETVVKTPNHPSYPAAHACYSMTAARVLAHLFPRDAEALMRLGHESGDSRIWAGIHYPSDVEAGRGIAGQVAARAIERARADGAGL